MSGRIDPELLEILICPRCGAEDLIVQRADDGAERALDCSACGVSYPVEDGIPIMLVEEARPIEGSYLKDPPRRT